MIKERLDEKEYTLSFGFNALPANEQQFDGLIRIVQALESDENESHILEVRLKGNDELDALKTAHFDDGFLLEADFPMDDFGWNHPLVLAGTGFTCEEICEVLYGILIECKSTEDIPVIMNGVMDVTGEFYENKL